MNVKDVHENTEPEPGFRAQAELGWGNGLENRKQLSVRRTDDETFALRGDALGIAKKGDAPEGERRESEGRPGRELKQKDINCEEQGNKAPTIAMNGNSQG